LEFLDLSKNEHTTACIKNSGHIALKTAPIIANTQCQSEKNQNPFQVVCTESAILDKNTTGQVALLQKSSKNKLIAVLDNQIVAPIEKTNLWKKPFLKIKHFKF